MAVGKVTQAAAKTGAAQQEPVFALSKDQKKQINDLIKAEAKLQPKTPRARSIAPRDGGTVFARYIAPSPDIVAKYLGPMPEQWSMDAHQALINKVLDDKKVTVKEARLIKALFNYDIDFVDSKGGNIRPDVAKFINDAFADVKMSKTARELLFGPNGPGYVPQPVYIVPPYIPGTDGPYYILPPGGQFPDQPDGPLYILPPGGMPAGSKRTSPQQALMDHLQSAKKSEDEE